MDSGDGRLDLKFTDRRKPEARSVAVSVLAKSLDALQRLAHLSGMRRDGHIPGRRIRPPAELQRRYQLVCDVPAVGSFIAPIRLAHTDLLSDPDADVVFSEMARVLSAVDSADAGAFAAIVPDEVWRRFYVDAIDGLLPTAEVDVALGIAYRGRSVFDSGRAAPFLKQLSRTSTKQGGRGTLLGSFKRVDFFRKEITIRHTGTERDLTCHYQDHVEESLLEHPRELLLVFGDITRDATGAPISIDEVDHIEAVDTSPIPIASTQANGVTIEPVERDLIAPVSFDEVSGVYTATLGNLGVSVCAETRDMLQAAVEDEIAVLWRHYASAADEALTAAARSLKQRVLAAFRELPSAA